MNDLNKFKVPSSPTAVVLSLTFICIVGLAGWTAYTYFLADAERVPQTIQATKYYTEDLESIYTEIEEYKTYPLQIESVEKGRQDPFF